MEEKWLISPSLLTGIADVVREKEGSSSEIPVSKLASRISGLSTGTAVQKKSGTFTTNSTGMATVVLGFEPDFVSLTLGNNDGVSQIAAGALFLDYVGSGVFTCMTEDGAGSDVFEFLVFLYAEENHESYDMDLGFEVNVNKIYDSDNDEMVYTVVSNRTFQYVAYKFT